MGDVFFWSLDYVIKMEALHTKNQRRAVERT